MHILFGIAIENCKCIHVYQAVVASTSVVMHLENVSFPQLEILFISAGVVVVVVGVNILFLVTLIYMVR